MVLAALVASLLMMVGACGAAALRLPPAVPLLLLVLGLAGCAAVAAFLRQALRQFAVRGAAMARERDASQALAEGLQAVLDGPTEGLLALDAEGRRIRHNQAFAALWGLPGSLLAAGDPGRVQDFMLGQLKDPERYLGRLPGPLGAAPAPGADLLEFWDGRALERNTRVLPGGGQVWSFRDVTARASADLFVHRLSAAVEQSPTTILLTDTAGTIEFVNPRFTQLTGYGLEEALGKNPRILQSGLTPPRVYEQLWATITGGEVWVGELQNRKKGGELFWERATIAPLRNDGGVITHYMALKEDITVQKQLEHQLRHSQKLEAVGLLAGGVAHDFNNVLQVINGYGTLMQLAQAPDDPHRASLEQILKAGDRAAQLTHSLLAFSRKQVMNKRTVDLNGVVASVEKLLRRIIGADVQLTVERLDRALPVHVDTGQIEQVLLNLGNNARDAMPAGGTLAIATREARLDESFRLAHGFGKPGPYAVLRVEDSGEGMDEATRRRVFDPFFTTRELGRGTGMGLASAYGIVKQHDGYILVESQEGRGSVFEVLLPLEEGLPAPGAPDPAQESRLRGTETILVAEDEPGVRTLVELVLRKFGYDVLLAADGQEAVDRCHDGIALVLMDLIMPRKSGRQASEEIRASYPEVKVLFTSGYAPDFLQTRGELEPGMALVMKPVQPQVLLRRIRELLDPRP